MTLHPMLQKIVDQTELAHLPPLSEQPLKQVRKNYARLAAWQGDRVALPKVESLVIKTPSGGLPLRIFYPQVDRTLPLCLYFHGGCFVKGDLETHDAICRRIAKESDVTVISLQYRLAPEATFPVPLQDAEEFYKWVCLHAKKLKVDCSRCALVGDNAGGNIAALLALKLRAKVALQVLICPQLDFSFKEFSHEKFAKGFLLEEASLLWARSLYVPKGVDYQDPNLSPLFSKELATAPPALVLTAEYDPLRDEAELYAKKLMEAGTQVSSHRFEGMTHGFFGLGAILEPANQAILEVAKSLRERL